MTIKQLKYIIAVTDNNFNISYTADKLFTSQPGISKQIKLLEESLDIEIFIRNGKALQGLTPLGEELIEQARIIISELENFTAISKKHRLEEPNQLTIATTQTQSSYVLPDIIQQFHQRHFEIKINILNGTTDQLVYIADNREADCIILSGIEEQIKKESFAKMILVPSYHWELILVCPKDHPLTQKKITLEDLSHVPLMTYITSKEQRSIIESTFDRINKKGNIIAQSNDPEILKNYVRHQMGVAIIASMAYDQDKDQDLISISLKDIFPRCSTIMAIERSKILKPYIFDFIKLFAPHITHADIELAANNKDNNQTNTPTLPKHQASWSI